MLLETLYDWTSDMVYLKLTAFLSFLAIAFSYFYVPVPDDMPEEDQRAMRKLYAFQQTGKIVAKVGAVLGVDSTINITRRFRNLMTSSIKQDSFEVETRFGQTMDGVSVTIHKKNPWDEKKEGLRPALVYIHGGGWVYEFPELYALMERYFAHHLNIIVVSINYRLAPEHPYPAAIEDCTKAIKYLHTHATEYGVDPGRISLAGDSGGGNLAAALALKLRDEGAAFLQRQILISPATQFASFRTSSYLANNRYAVLSRFSCQRYWLLYMNASLAYVNELEANEHVSSKVAQSNAWSFLQKYQDFPQSKVKVDEKVSKVLEKKLLDPYLCPLMAETMKGLPPTLVLISEYDVLKDDALAYVDRLKADGVETAVSVTNGYHGIYCSFNGTKSGMQMMMAIFHYLRPLYAAQK
ncbi:hypothetical protein RvY_02258 [Ramazzottius varieornatus]|uniref:Alpha/beta hydrolase fold-3 domain-containing protein n=1 Tax=Ramazzottius varieornatus TaxID=947166 RepID=A0A1D1UR53_RAMVA|nr:hypothetical protein RvY_02258 [Ramazzottius varieornatus]